MRSNTPPPEVLAVTEGVAAKMVSLSTRSMFELRRQGRIDFIKVGSGPKARILYPKAALDRFIVSNTTVATGR
jgi:hypothetical protein